MRKDWEYKKLGEVANVVMGQSPDGSNVNNENGMEFHQGKINFGEQFLMKSDCFTTQVTKVAEKGSILLCVRAPIGIINITDRDICIGRGLCAIKEKTEVDNLFLYYYLLNKKLYFEKNSTGSTFKAISSKVVLNTPIFLPPKPTQLAIVAELDKINELIQLKKQQLKDYDQLAQSIFYEMFGDPVENEKGWEVKKLKEVCDLKAGKAIKANELSNDNPYPCYGGNGIRGYINRCSHVESSPIIGRQGAYCGTVNFAEAPFYATEHAVVVRAKQDMQIKWLYYTLVNLKLTRYAKGQAQPGIAVSSLNELVIIPLPPLPLQQQFAARIEAIERQKQQVSETIKDLETLLASRMQYWFD